MTVVGPAPAYIARRADRWRWNVVLRGARSGRPARRRRRRAVVGRRRPRIAALRIGRRGTFGRCRSARSCDDVGHHRTEEPPHDRATRPQPQRPADPGRDLHLDTVEPASGIRRRLARRRAPRDPARSAGASGSSSGGTTATAILESIRDAIDDLAERATPTVREFSARAAEFAAVAADKAAPFARSAPATRPPTRAASSPTGRAPGPPRCARRSPRATRGPRPHAAASTTRSPAATDVPPPPAPDAGTTPSDGATPA